MQPLLTISIPTTIDRQESFTTLLNELTYQITENDLEDIVVVDWECDDKEMSVGVKRDLLYKRAKGEYCWQIDSDDFIDSNAIKLVYDALQTAPDCVTFRELCTINGDILHGNFSLQYDDWHDNPPGFNHARTPFFKTPIRTDLCQQVGVADMRWGEDHDFAIRIKPLLQTEVYIPVDIYHYIHWSTEHNERYGIK